MTDLSLASPAQTGKSRSLFQYALLRFRRNTAAMVSLAILVIVSLFCIVGPFFAPHNYDDQFKSYLLVPPSLSPYPKDTALKTAMQDVADQARLKLDAFEASGTSFTATFSDEKPIDPRKTRYIDRTNEFENATVAETRNDGRTVVVKGHIKGQYFLLGTDSNGRDMLPRIMLGGQISLLVGILASMVSLIIGVTYGAISGFIGGRTDNVMMRFVEIVYSLPFTFIVILLVVFFGRYFILIFLAIGAVEWLDMARIVRGQTLSLRRREFVAAAQAMGLSQWAVIRRHIIPNLLGAVVIFLTVRVPRIILLESFLSFLGLGVQEPMASWGSLIAVGANAMQANPWLLIYPSCFLVVTLFCLNFIGDGLRDAFDPKDR